MITYLRILAIVVVTLVAGYITTKSEAPAPAPEPPIRMAPFEKVGPVPELKFDKPLEIKRKETAPECSKDCEEKVRQYYADVPVLVEVARCESQFKQYDEQGNVLRNHEGSSATGVMQIMYSVHAKAAQNLGYDITKLEGNLGYGKHLYETEGLKPWDASRDCWAGTLAYAQ